MYDLKISRLSMSVAKILSEVNCVQMSEYISVFSLSVSAGFSSTVFYVLF